MAVSVRSFALALLFVMLFMATEMAVEARVCTAPSGRYRGGCFRNQDSNCAIICQTENFDSGHCQGLKCICTKRCTAN